MHPQHEVEAYNAEQARRCRKLFAAVVFATVREFIIENRAYPGQGAARMRRWANSRDGHTVLTCAGIEPSETVTEALVQRVIDGNLKGFDDDDDAALAA